MHQNWASISTILLASSWYQSASGTSPYESCLTHCGLVTQYSDMHLGLLTLAQVMACCLMAPSHYLNQCWLIISEVWHSPELKIQDIYPWYVFENDPFKITATSPGQWVKSLFTWHIQERWSCRLFHISSDDEAVNTTAFPYNKTENSLPVHDKIYRQISNIRDTKFQNLAVSRLAVVFAQSIEARC